MQLDDEILQDFLLEAQEILENLDPQLVTLESAPDDRDLLNTVFRGFHTIKGGAGFLGLDAIVDIAHKAEDIFGLLRNGQRHVNPRLMDVVLRVLDALREMFAELRDGKRPQPAATGLLDALRALATDVDTSAMMSAHIPGVAMERAAITAEACARGDDEMAAAMVAPPSDPISDAEFEALLDQLQRQGETARTPPPTEVTAAPVADDSQLISDDEFEALLDNLHGAGRFGGTATRVAAPFDDGMVAKRVEAANEFKDKSLVIADPLKGLQKDTTVRVETEVLDRIMNMVGELVLIRNRLGNLQAAIGNAEMTQIVANLDVVTSDLQMAAMKTRMQPIKKVLGRFPRVVRDLARSLQKEIELELVGEDTDLDKNLVEALSDPLVHLVRNAVDHGIELPEQRVAAGKPRGGTLRLSAEQDGDQILLTIRDDGKGMDAEVLRAKAIEQGLLDRDAASRLSDRECFELIFLPGFSTKDEVSDLSGRGVGMDVVKTRITQLNGSIEIDSRLGLGTTIRIRVPLTLAIMPTLMVILGRQIFALPLINVKEIIDFKSTQAREVNGRSMLVVRGKALPLFYLSRWLVGGVTKTTVAEGHVVVATVGNQSIGFLVDELIGQEEVVIKPLGAMLHGTKGVAGATITGNGRIALILDLPELIDAYAGRH